MLWESYIAQTMDKYGKTKILGGRTTSLPGEKKRRKHKSNKINNKTSSDFYEARND